MNGWTWHTPVSTTNLSVVSPLKRGFPQKTFFSPENEVWLVLTRSSKAVSDFWGPAPCLTLSVNVCAELIRETEALSDPHMSLCCLLLLDANHSELCLQLLEACLDEEKDNSQKGQRACIFLPKNLSFRTPLNYPIVYTGLQSCSTKAKCFLWG